MHVYVCLYLCVHAGFSVCMYADATWYAFEVGATVYEFRLFDFAVTYANTTCLSTKRAANEKDVLCHMIFT